MVIQSGKFNLWNIMGQINFNKYVVGEKKKMEKTID